MKIIVGLLLFIYYLKPMNIHTGKKTINKYDRHFFFFGMLLFIYLYVTIVIAYQHWSET
jgi:hypothetical protein